MGSRPARASSLLHRAVDVDLNRRRVELRLDAVLVESALVLLGRLVAGSEEGLQAADV